MPPSPSRSTTGIAVAVYGMLSTIADAIAENQRSAMVASSRRPPSVACGERVGEPADDPGLDDRLDEDEQADEEEERRPLDLAQGLVRVEAGDEHQDRRPEQRDRRGFEVRCAVEQEADDRQRPSPRASG